LLWCSLEPTVTPIFKDSLPNEAAKSVLLAPTTPVVGENVAEFQYGSIGVGIRGMRQRAKEFGGVLRLENTNSGIRA
jgi:signal transduction histidine kinase